MSTEAIDPTFADIDRLPLAEAVARMAAAQVDGARVAAAGAERIAAAAEAAADRLRRGDGRLIHVGAGTSGRLALQDNVELVPTFGWPPARLAFLIAGGTPALLRAVEGAEDDAAAGAREMKALEPGAGDVVVAVAASGRTPFTLAAARTARENDALTIGLSNNADAPLLAQVDHPILLDTGAEAIAGSTRMKAGTAQKVALGLLSTAIMVRLGRVHEGMMVAMRPTNRKLEQRAVEMVARLSEANERESRAALEATQWDVRLAVLVVKGASPEEAERRLSAAGGVLREALETD